MARPGRKPNRAAVTPERLKLERGGCFIHGHLMEQADAAELIGVSRVTWSRWETGKAGMSRDYYEAWTAESEPYRNFDVLPGGQLKWRTLPTALPAARPPGPFEATIVPAGSDPLGQPDLVTGLPDARELEEEATRIDSDAP